MAGANTIAGIASRNELTGGGKGTSVFDAAHYFFVALPWALSRRFTAA
jgi:hypothetical protein